MLIIVYMIVGIFVFLTLQLILGKFFPKAKRIRYLASGIFTLPLTPLIVKGIFILFFSVLFFEYHPEREFSVLSWQENVEDRHEMGKTLIASEILLGKSRTQIADKIGLPNDNINLEQDTLSKWKYFMGRRKWGFGLKFYYLHIEFENANSVEIYIQESID